VPTLRALTVRLYLDENVNRQLGLILLALGFDVVFARDVLPPHTSDHIHLATAARSGRILLTHDRDYQLLHCAWRDWFNEYLQAPLPRHGGLLLIPQHPVLSLFDAVAVVRGFLEDATVGSYANRLFEWTANSGWLELEVRV
jgi:hypothetical protein